MGKGIQEQSELRAKGEPCQAAQGSVWARQAGKNKPGRVTGRKRPRWKTGSREEKAFKDARLNMGFLAKEQ